MVWEKFRRTDFRDFGMATISPVEIRLPNPNENGVAPETPFFSTFFTQYNQIGCLRLYGWSRKNLD